MTLKFKILLALLATSAVVAQDNCKEKYTGDEEKTDTGCKSCIDGPYYLKDVTPPPTLPTNGALSLFQLEQDPPKVWNCIKCPDFATKCEWKDKKVVIETCEAKYYLDAAPAETNDSCKACPAKSTSCKKENEKVIVEGCEEKFYRNIPETGNETCEACPANSKSCKMDAETKKIVIDENGCETKFYVGSDDKGNICSPCPANSKACKMDANTKKIVIDEDGCDAKFYIGSDDKGNVCKTCPVELGCTQCADDKVCKPAEEK